MLDKLETLRKTAAALLNDLEARQNVDTLDTKGFPTDGTHYTGPGQVKIGIVTAQRWLNMHFNYSPAVAVAREYSFPQVSQAQTFVAPLSPAMLFDLSGRKIGNADRPFPSNGIFIRVVKQTGKLQGYGIRAPGK